MLQDKNGDYWFGTDGAGLYRYDGKNLLRLTAKNGLCSDFIFSIQEDIKGDLWLGTGNGLCRYNGRSFINYTDTLKNVSENNSDYKNGDLLFNDEGIVYHFNGKSFSRLIIHPGSYKPDPSNLDRPYGTYCTMEDKSGNLWFGTDEKGVCRYDGKLFTYFTEKGLNGAAVRTIFQDKNGNIWFGNNGYGLFCYDGKTITNFTEEHGLGNPGFLKKTGKSDKPENLARVWTINEDHEGRLWIGTIDAGVWCYDGKDLTHYTVKDGFTSNAIITIYKDKKGDLWFITEGAGICTFNGTTFKDFIIK